MSVEQRMRALEQANVVRLTRARSKKELKRGEITLLQALGRPELQSMLLYDLLCCQKAWGQLKATALMRRMAVGPGKTVESLTDRQKGELCQS